MSLPAPAVPDEPDKPGGEVSRRRATEISQSRLMPEHFADDPANVQYVMEIGNALGVDPVMALSHVHVFADGDGKLKSGLSADLMVALVRNAGHIVHIESKAAKATATLIRTDITPEKLDLLKQAGIDPKQYMVFTATWTEERAQEMGLMNKRNWKLYTREMLVARAKSAVVRMGASEVLLGVRRQFAAMGIELTDDRDDEIALASARYTPDELGVETDEEGVPVRGSATLHREAPKKDPIREFVKNSTAEDIAEWAKTTAEDSGVTNSEKLERFKIVHSLCEEMGQLESPLNIPDPENPSTTKPTNLHAVLMSHVKPLLLNS